MNRTGSAYSNLVAAGELRPDPDQAVAAARLGMLEESLASPAGGILARLLGRRRQAPRGIYLWGAVGRGKSMLMDLFYRAVEVSPKRRVHFHAFMIEVHGALHALRKSRLDDPIARVAADMASRVRLLAFDELQITNVADATIVSRLFTALLAKGVCIVATSNRPPRDLYKDGLGRELFLPFIDLVERELDIVGLNGPTDYRLDRLGGMATYYTPNGAETTAALSDAFFRLTDYPPEDRAHVPSETLPVGGGRTLFVPKSLKGVAVFSFKRLCAEARGAADYLAAAQCYHTIIIVGVPRLGVENRNEAARFVALVDTFYEYRVKLLVGADAPPGELYVAGDGRFEFDRTVSRLIEMQSADYLAEGHGIPAA